MFWKGLFKRPSATQARSFGLPEGDLVYAVGDIHGRADLLSKMIDLIMHDMQGRSYARARIVFLGDYVDRGFHSKEVIESLVNLQVAGAQIVCLAGNHEDMMLQFLEDPTEGQLWLGVGGLATLASYGVLVEDDMGHEALVEASLALRSALPAAHLEFLRGLGEHLRLGDVLFVHAGLRPGIPLTAQRRSDKLGIRRDFTESKYDFEVRVVHGHTGVREPYSSSKRVAVDTGAFATGILTAAICTGAEVSFLKT